MECFNDYQFDTYAPILYKKVKSNKDEYLSMIAHMYSTNDDFDKDDDEKFKKSMIRLSGAGAAGEIACVLTNVINKNSLSELLTSAGIYTGFVAISALVNTLIFLGKYKKNFQKLVETTYSVLLSALIGKIEEAETLTLDDIHKITDSLNSGEYDEKYSNIPECGKLNIDVLYIDEYTDSIYENVDEASILRVYEELMHVCSMAYEGYEMDVINGYYILRSYTSMLAQGKKDEETIASFEKYASYIETRCVNNARKRH